MQKKLKSMLAFLMASALCLSLPISVYAEEPSEEAGAANDETVLDVVDENVVDKTDIDVIDETEEESDPEKEVTTKTVCISVAEQSDTASDEPVSYEVRDNETGNIVAEGTVTKETTQSIQLEPGVYCFSDYRAFFKDNQGEENDGIIDLTDETVVGDFQVSIYYCKQLTYVGIDMASEINFGERVYYTIINDETGDKYENFGCTNFYPKYFPLLNGTYHIECSYDGYDVTITDNEVSTPDGIISRPGEIKSEYNRPEFTILLTKKKAEVPVNPQPSETPANTILEGNNSVYNPDNNDTLTFRSSAEFKDFTKVSVDGKEISQDNYIAKEGSIIITLKSEYLKTLPSGNHTITIHATTGDVQASFKVEKTTTSDMLTQTGDSNLVFVWGSLGLVSAGLFTLLIKSKKRVL